jgi:hypothetical protein
VAQRGEEPTGGHDAYPRPDAQLVVS